MKKSINLLIRRQTYEYKEKIFARIRVGVVIIGVICVSSLVFVFSIKTAENIQKQKLLSKKEDYLTELLTKKDIEKKVDFFDKKSTVLVSTIDKDMHFLEYYRFLQEQLPLSTPPAELSTIQFDSGRKVNFTLRFARYDDFHQILNNFEKNQFLRNFDTITLSAFTVSSEKANESFEIVFNGTLKDILHEKNN
ncbi:MAG TPA: hypothetical protein VJB63_01005 [Patescibacteria group bacterium]|nr:hypothetical protein [Patescibacteria group bacterium]